MRNEINARFSGDLSKPLSVTRHRLTMQQLLPLNLPLTIDKANPHPKHRLALERHAARLRATQPEERTDDGRLGGENLLDRVEFELALFELADRCEVAREL